MTAVLRIIEVDEVDSTNDEARRRAHAGEPIPFWVRADRQRKGRGRRGRTWVSLPGNVFLSGFFRLHRSAAEAAQLSFAAALAVAETLEDYVEPARITLKWPNDVKLDSAKVAGVLLEAQDAGKGVELIVGIGVNLVHAPQGVEQATTALALALGREPPMAEHFAPLVAGKFEDWRQRWARDGFEPVRAAWLARAQGLGEKVSATRGRVRLEGVFQDLDADGALVMMTPGGRRIIRSGEVAFGDAEGAV